MSPEVPIIVLILAVPIYFICLWGMKKIKVGTTKSRRFLAIIPTLVLIPIVYVGMVTLVISCISYYPKIDFNKTEWTTNIEDRYKMSEDILESKMLIGKTHEEVTQLLVFGFPSDNEDRIIYELGFVPGLFNIDPDFLEITLQNGIVISVTQYEG